MTASFHRLASLANRVLESTTSYNLIQKSNLEKLRASAVQPRDREEGVKSVGREFAHPTYVMTTLHDGLSIWLDLSDYGVSRVCLEGSYEPAESQFILDFLKSGQTFVDIGANIGWFSLHAAQRVGQTGNVIAIEPRRGTMELLRKSVEANSYQHRIELHNCALGEIEGLSRIAWADDMGNPGGTWLMVEPAIEQQLAAEGHSFQDTPVLTLDEIVGDRTVDLIKIDIEGVEPLAMKGATKVLTQARPAIISEINAPLLKVLSQVSASDYIDWYRQFGYRAFLLSDDGKLTEEIHPGSAPQNDVTNVVFLPNA